MAKEIAEDYASSLADLTVNSKPLINVLTILAEENVDHAGAIVETVEKHLEKASSDTKLPVLYLVDSIMKNVGGEYGQKFSQIIVNMFTKTFKAVDEKTRSQMFKLRETWHEVFPATKLYQLDVKVNLIDPAWPIQAQPPQPNHFNQSLHNKPGVVAVPGIIAATTSKVDDEQMRLAVARKEQELLMLQRKKVQLELEQARRQLQQAEKVEQTVTGAPTGGIQKSLAVPDTSSLTLKQRLGPPVTKPANAVGRIAPVSGAMLAAVRDPRLARRQPPVTALVQPIQPTQAIAADIFDVKPLERNPKVTKRKNVITIDVAADSSSNTNENGSRDPRNRRGRFARNSEPRHRREDGKERFRHKLHDKRKASTSHRRREGDKSNRRYDDENSRKSSEKEKSSDKEKDSNDVDAQSKVLNKSVEEIVPRFMIADTKKINKLPPIPKLSKSDNKKSDELTPSPSKKRKESHSRQKPLKKREDGKESSEESSSPEKKIRNTGKGGKSKVKETDAPEAEGDEVVSFKELKNYHKERYMRRNKEKSESPEKIVTEKIANEECKAPDAEGTNVSEAVVENMDVDLRQLLPADPAAPIGQKRPSTESMESKTTKKHKFDILFGSEDVDLRQLPQVDETAVKTQPEEMDGDDSPQTVCADESSPIQKDWAEIKEKHTPNAKKNPSQLDLVRAKLAEATKGKDRLGRNLRFSNSGDKDKRRAINSEDTDLRINNDVRELDPENDKESIKIIISQAEEQYKEGNINKEQYNTLMFQVMQINERLKLKEAKQRESLEESKRKLHNVHHSGDEDEETIKKDNTFGDIDERVKPIVPPRELILDGPDLPLRLSDGADSDLRITNDIPPIRPPMQGYLQRPILGPAPYHGPQGSMWRGSRSRLDEFNGPRAGRMRAPMPPFMRNNFDNRGGRNFEMMPMPLPPPMLGHFQGESPVPPYTRAESPLPLGTPGICLPLVDVNILEYIDQDPMKTIEIDGVSREIRFYGDKAIVMLDWDNPREIRFLPGSRRITFDNKDSIVLAFNEGYITAEVDDQVFNIRFGAPTRELYINDRWYECFFGGPPTGIVIDGVPRLIQLEGPPPKVDIGTEKRTDLVAGKINMIVDAVQMCPVFLDAKPQKFLINNVYNTIRFVDSLRTVLINEVPFKVEFGGLPRPIFIGKTKHFIRFSVLPRNIKPGQVSIANMEGRPAVSAPTVPTPNEINHIGTVPLEKPLDTFVERDLNLEENSNPGLDLLASVMPSSMAPASQFSGYSLGSTTEGKIPGLETPVENKPAPSFPFLENINVTDLFAKLVATGIVPTPDQVQKEKEERQKRTPPRKVAEEDKKSTREDKNKIKPVNLLQPETLRVKQPGIVEKLYGGMQCSGCGTRFPPEHTVRYSQHLDWHFRQNRRERDSARRAHSRLWHYDLADWVRYEEIEDLDEREKSYFETANAEGEGDTEMEAPEGETPSVPAGAPADQFCALCGDKFDQFYNEDKEEWHLRKAVRHEDNNYHPLCYEELKNQITKDEVKEPLDETEDDPSLIIIDKSDLIEIDDKSQSDNESVVEVLEEDKTVSEPVEIDEGDEDDVVLKAEPVEEVLVDDEVDTDDETKEERAERDRIAAIDFANIKIKQEPIDPDDEPVITAEEQITHSTIETTQHTVLTSIDGNVQHETRTVTANIPSSGIRINISKLPVVTRAPAGEGQREELSSEEVPQSPEQMVEPEYALKPALQGVELIKQPPVQRGSELSGLCSIM